MRWKAAACLGLVGLAMTVCAQEQTEPDPVRAQELYALTNQARAAVGERALAWDAALANAALQHCLRVAQEHELAHRYGGEASLTARASAAGAHFSVLEENVAMGSRVERIHEGWMDSMEHRENLLNPDVDRVGIAVVAESGGLLFAVAEYARSVPVRTREEVEAAFARQLRRQGVTIREETDAARRYCAQTGNFHGWDPPGFVVRWQNPDLTRLPDQLSEVLASGRYRRAEVGSCAPQDLDGPFTVYRVAVLLW